MKLEIQFVQETEFTTTIRQAVAAGPSSATSADAWVAPAVPKDHVQSHWHKLVAGLKKKMTTPVGYQSASGFYQGVETVGRTAEELVSDIREMLSAEVNPEPKKA